MVMSLSPQERSFLRQQRIIRNKAHRDFRRNLRAIMTQYGSLAAQAYRNTYTPGLQPEEQADLVEQLLPPEEETGIPLLIFPLLFAAYSTLQEQIGDNLTILTAIRTGAGATALNAEIRRQEVIERLRLLRFREQTRTRLVRVLQAQVDSRLPTRVENFIRVNVPRGRYNALNTWVDIIANTEANYVRNNAMLNAAESNPRVAALRALDNQTNFNDRECVARNGRIFSFEEARRELNDEHVNGTLEFIPILAPV